MKHSKTSKLNSVYDNAKHAFDQLVEELEKNRCDVITEQDARFQIIDRLLSEVLNWDHFDIKTERRAGKGYADYLIQIGQRNKIVIEAKRESATLLDSATEKLGHYKLSSSSLKSAQDGIVQASEYCAAKGTRYAILTSGYQWIFFWAIRDDGLEPGDGKAIVFPSLKSITENFSIFYDLLSKEGVNDNRHIVQLNKAEKKTHDLVEPLYTPISDKRVSLIPYSEIARSMQPIFRSFFSIISGDDNREMLAKCFVESKNSKEADISLQKIAQHLEGNIATLNSQDGDELKEQIKKAISVHVGEFVLIVGQKGAGKTTFIDRFFNIVLDSNLRKQCLVIRIDIGKYDNDITTLNQKLLREFIHLIEKELFSKGSPSFEQLQGIFNEEYNRRKHGVARPLYDSNKNDFDIEFGRIISKLMEENPNEYVVKLLQNSVRSRSLMPCVIFDNTDQFSQEFQEAVFQCAQSIFTRIDYAFFICPITDRSIWQLSKSGPFQSYPTRQFYLPVPKAGEILQKRVSFLKSKVHEEKKKPTNYFLNKGMSFSIENLEMFAAYIEEVFINEEFVTGKIGKLSNFEIRRMLNLSEKVITSPVLSTDDLFKTYIIGNRNSIRPDKIDKAIIRGNHNFYDIKNNDYVFNVFQIDQNHVTSPLIFLRILKLLECLDIQASGDLDIAYLSLDQIQNFFDAMGVNDSTVYNCINKLYSLRLLESFDPSLEIITGDNRVRITPSGKVHIELAFRNKIYVSSMSIRTPIRNPTISEEIRDLHDKYNTEPGEKYFSIRSKFISYCCEEDKKFIHIPTAVEYVAQGLLLSDFMGSWLRVNEFESQQEIAEQE